GWNLESSRVLTRIAGATEDRPIASELPLINETNVEDAWLTFKTWDSKLTQPRLRVEIPTGFGEMQRSSPDRARDWRTASRDMFTTYMARGYQVVEFVFDRAAGRGWYFLER
ncbi:MAG: GNAT family N-acetyltransferase, partial [Acidobacteriota bacterium]|nr:GNAT family N-acetyltransferase [Acidobacteriota bacterium]